MPTAPTRRRKAEPVARAVGVVEDADLKHVVHVVRTPAGFSVDLATGITSNVRSGAHYCLKTYQDHRITFCGYCCKAAGLYIPSAGSPHWTAAETYSRAWPLTSTRLRYDSDSALLGSTEPACTCSVLSCARGIAPQTADDGYMPGPELPPRTLRVSSAVLQTQHQQRPPERGGRHGRGSAPAAQAPQQVTFGGRLSTAAPSRGASAPGNADSTNSVMSKPIVIFSRALTHSLPNGHPYSDRNHPTRCCTRRRLEKAVPTTQDLSRANGHALAAAQCRAI